MFYSKELVICIRYLIKKGDKKMDKKERPFAWTVDILRRANLRPTCQRMGLVKLLYGNGNRMHNKVGMVY